MPRYDPENTDGNENTKALYSKKFYQYSWTSGHNKIKVFKIQGLVRVSPIKNLYMTKFNHTI